MTNQSQSTGWGINDPKWGGYQSVSHYSQPVPLRMAFIEGGVFVMGQNQDNLLWDYNNIARKATVSSFYMDEVETSNFDYNEYIYWLERVYGQEYPEVVNQARPDQLAWNDVASFRDPLRENYFVHPAYSGYPVVGVTWEQATEYCKWRTDRVNEKILVDAKILELDLAQTSENHFNTEAYLAGQYEGMVKKGLTDMNPNATEPTRRVRKSDGILIEKFRLPTEAEWEYAALALVGNTYTGRVLERKVYPWNGYGVRAAQKEYRGDMMANFTQGSGDLMGTAGDLNDGAEFPTNVYSYFPNDYGLYNMAGNVSEWVMDVYRPLTFENASEMNPFRGNYYTTLERDEEGQIAEKDSLGRLRYRPYTAEELADRRNFNKSDNDDYLDGDYESAIVDNWLEKPSDPISTSLVYDFGKTTLISDRSRVVKGGSWKDRAFFLSPGERRFLDQNLSTDWIGFRCAMSRVGSANGGNIVTR
ncbi:MAG: SUMF1/EgtB/PvdO family nonheme iron enzyme [Bacteroidales bacterium]